MKRHLIIIALLAVLVPGVLLAQDELTLEGLAGQVAELVENVADLAKRVATIEAVWTGPGSISLQDGDCVIALDDSLQDETVLKFKERYDEWLDVDSVDIVQVHYLSETGHIAVVHEEFWEDKYVIETWDGCEFLGSSDWWEED